MEYIDSIKSSICCCPITSGIIFILLLKFVINFLKRPKAIKDEVVFMTGGASGIGRQMSIQFAKQGAKVIIADLNEKQAKVVAYEIKQSGGQALGIHCDVTSIESVKTAAQAARIAFGPITILVNNAGIVSGKLITELSYETIERTFKVNAISHFYTIKEFLPSMLEQNKGHIVTIASVAGLGGVSKMTDYCASKYAAVGIDDSLRNELKSLNSNVKTTCVCPYYINTGMFKGVSTKFNFLFPMLSEQWVAGRIIQAVKYDEEVLLMPKTMNSSYYIKAFLPVSWTDYLSHALGFQASMNTFQGRH